MLVVRSVIDKRRGIYIYIYKSRSHDTSVAGIDIESLLVSSAKTRRPSLGIIFLTGNNRSQIEKETVYTSIVRPTTTRGQANWTCALKAYMAAVFSLVSIMEIVSRGPYSQKLFRLEDQSLHSTLAHQNTSTTRHRPKMRYHTFRDCDKLALFFFSSILASTRLIWFMRARIEGLLSIVAIFTRSHLSNVIWSTLLLTGWYIQFLVIMRAIAFSIARYLEILI